MNSTCHLYVLRHGRSLANERGVICARLENGVKPEFSLAPLGRKQATMAGRQLKQEVGNSITAE